jgi:uncharacterized membrane protein YfcA
VLLTFALCGFAFLAGFIDSVVGGGGLIQLPAMLLLLPAGTPLADVFGTNKVASICGTMAAMWNYTRNLKFDWAAILPAAGMGFVFSALGALTLAHLHPAGLRPVILVLLVAVAIYTFIRKDFGSLHAPRLSSRTQTWIGMGIGSVLGFYDGFFGPGTGSFLIFLFIGLFGFNFLAASAAAKVINSATNASAVLYFASTGHVLYRFALPMAACNIIGSVVGTRMALLRGSQFVRVLFLVVVTAIICKLGYDLARHPG